MKAFSQWLLAKRFAPRRIGAYTVSPLVVLNIISTLLLANVWVKLLPVWVSVGGASVLVALYAYWFIQYRRSV